MEELELGVWSWRCKKTEKVFEALDWDGDYGGFYGVFLMYDIANNVYYWDVVLDEAFKLCSKIVDDTVPPSMDEKLRRKIFHNICGICCDRGSNGSILQIKPYCPYCHDDEVYPVDAISTKRVSIPEVTHHQWNSLTDEGKKNLVLSELRRKNLI